MSVSKEMYPLKGWWCPEGTFWACSGYQFHKVWVSNVPPLCTERRLFQVLRERCRCVQGVRLHKNHQQATAYVWSRQDVEKVKSHSMSITVNGQSLQLDVWETTATHEEPGCVSTVTSPICAEEKDGSTEPNTTTSSNAKMPLQPAPVALERTSALIQVPAGSLPSGSPSSSASTCATARDLEDSCAAEQLRPGLAFEKELKRLRAEKEAELWQLKAEHHRERSADYERLRSLKSQLRQEGTEASRLLGEVRRLKLEKDAGAANFILELAARDVQLEELLAKLDLKAEKEAAYILELEKLKQEQDTLILRNASATAQAEQLKKDAEQLRLHFEKKEEEVKLASAKLEEMEHFLTELGQELSGACMDPILMQPMKDPVLAADLHTYDRDSIEAWHKVNPTSPHTRAPLEITTLRSNKAALMLAEVNDKVAKIFGELWPAKALPVAEARTVVSVLVEGELLKAITSRNEDGAVELLARPVDDRYLNGMIKYRGEEWTLLEVALIRQLPRVAQAVASRPDFRRGHCCNGGVYPIHLATALGYGNVCQSLIDDFGASLLTCETEGTMAYDLPTGETVTIPAGLSCWDLARHLQNESLLALFEKLSET